MGRLTKMPSFQDLKTQLSYSRKLLNSNISTRNNSITRISEEKNLLRDSRKIYDNTLLAQNYIQQIAQQVQTQSHKQLTKVVSKCLSAVFQEPYELRIEFERKRGRTEAEFIYLRNGRK